MVRCEFSEIFKFENNLLINFKLRYRSPISCYCLASCLRSFTRRFAPTWFVLCLLQSYINSRICIFFHICKIHTCIMIHYLNFELNSGSRTFSRGTSIFLIKKERSKYFHRINLLGLLISILYSLFFFVF